MYIYNVKHGKYVIAVKHGKYKRSQSVLKLCKNSILGLNFLY